METRLAPGEETLLHTHPIESVVVVQSDSEFRIINDDGATDGELPAAGEAILKNNMARIVLVEALPDEPVAFGAPTPVVLSRATSPAEVSRTGRRVSPR